MANMNALEFLYKKRKTAIEFNFDMLTAPPLLSLLTPQDIFELNRIARSVKLSGKIEEKYRMIDNIMGNRGFVKLHAGTNRVVYRFIEDQRFVAKIAIDKVGLGDNPAEFNNQFILKPFVTKIFEVSPCGTIAFAERVDPIMSREEFLSVADDIFNLITKFFIGKYVIEDFGTHYFMNWAVRNGFGPVLLDFPYVYELDGNKLYCNAKPIPGRRDIICGGELDYDDGFNNLICTKCGRMYNARDLKKDTKNELIIVGGKKTMNVKVMRGNEVLVDSSKKKIAKVIDPEPKNKMAVSVTVPKAAIFNKKEEIKMEEKDEIKKESTRPSSPVVDTEIIEEDVVDVKYNDINDDEVIEDDLTPAIEEETEDEDMDEIDSIVDNYQDDEYEDDDELDYEEYLNNRDRQQLRRDKKQNRRNDFNDNGF